MRPDPSRGQLLGCVLLLLVLLSAPAQAATVTQETRTFNGLRYLDVILTAAPGEHNRVTATFADGAFLITDAGNPVTDAAAACEPAGPDAVRCTGGQLRAALGDGDDEFDGAGTVDAGPGDDVVRVRGSADGGEGDDVLDASAATNPATLTGGPGDDVLIGGSSADDLSGGLGEAGRRRTPCATATP